MTHTDALGRARMVNVREKPVTNRTAVAEGRVRMNRESFDRVLSRDVPKGDVFAAARIAGIQAAKKTSELIPLCHLLPVESIEVDIAAEEQHGSFLITATVDYTGKTGVEMEALTAVSVAALTMYDMCKSLDKSIEISDIRLIRKSGGKSGTFRRDTGVNMDNSQ